ncbi:hypothetical protein ECDEC15A_1157 [Escherichia coli DEC15A]|nr:hypothetical protein ECDEC15A_1157 [Escherichia coli DEC15A]EHY13426.1 hypothetical protein ECDEC15D_2894 [Escherichia coli DEC15D]EHY20338.1 hypothetical protein ECDEC15E_1315 [Escherichia coli DEC15E]KDW71746.1 hypothetical protein AB14_3730 [Escherichia coli 1-392-07_S1_C1]KDW78565.1 hypothetical protein AB42_4772 [Escherichia coli 1-392-07_S1_C2]KEJ19547.1 hypothetical protein AB50_5343 [Escherichia coli 6-175-07_S1_C2]
MSSGAGFHHNGRRGTACQKLNKFGTGKLLRSNTLPDLSWQ